MRLVGFAQARHPELEQFDVVLLRRSEDAQELLRVLFGSTVHLGEFKKDLHLAVEKQKRNTQIPQHNHRSSGPRDCMASRPTTALQTEPEFKYSEDVRWQGGSPHLRTSASLMCPPVRTLGNRAGASKQQKRRKEKFP